MTFKKYNISPEFKLLIGSTDDRQTDIFLKNNFPHSGVFETGTFDEKW